MAAITVNLPEKCSACKAGFVSAVAFAMGRKLCWICHSSFVRMARQAHWTQ